MAEDPRGLGVAKPPITPLSVPLCTSRWGLVDQTLIIEDLADPSLKLTVGTEDADCYSLGGIELIRYFLSIFIFIFFSLWFFFSLAVLGKSKVGESSCQAPAGATFIVIISRPMIRISDRTKPPTNAFLGCDRTKSPESRRSGACHRAWTNYRGRSGSPRDLDCWRSHATPLLRYPLPPPPRSPGRPARGTEGFSGFVLALPSAVPLLGHGSWQGAGFPMAQTFVDYSLSRYHFFFLKFYVLFLFSPLGSARPLSWFGTLASTMTHF